MTEMIIGQDLKFMIHDKCLHANKHKTHIGIYETTLSAISNRIYKMLGLGLGLITQ
jgi:DNA-binding Xre family transcriptional regulator